MAPAIGFEPTTNGLTVRCATAAPRRISQGAAYSRHAALCKPPKSDFLSWRSGAELNRRSRFCRPVPDHSATGPPERGTIPRAQASLAPRPAEVKRAPQHADLARRRGGPYKPAAREGIGFMDYADARKRMVDGQLRPNRVTDPRVLDAMRDLPREEFLPAEVRARAYSDEDVPLPGGRTLVAPMVIARLAQLAAVRPGDRALVVCAGTGYGAAVLARCGARVTAIETDATLAAIARHALAANLAAGAVRIEAGRPTEGFAGGAPYDVDSHRGRGAGHARRRRRAIGRRRPLGDGAGQWPAWRRGGAGAPDRRCDQCDPVFDCATVALPDFSRRPASSSEAPSAGGHRSGWVTKHSPISWPPGRETRVRE